MKIVQYNSDMGWWIGLTLGQNYTVLKETETQYVVANSVYLHSTVPKNEFIIIQDGEVSPTAFLEWRLENKMQHIKDKEDDIAFLLEEINKNFKEFTDIRVELGELNEKLRLEKRT